jgi:hypothetical protein
MGSEQGRTIVRRGKQLLAVGVSTALAAGALVVAWPAIAAGPTYYACYDPGGYLYNVSTSPPSCPQVSVIKWNERGARGPAGAKGEKGQRGKKGRAGEDGKVGPKGDTGPRGAQGPALELVTYSVSASTSGEAGRLMTVSASCDEGDLATGGGFDTDGTILASVGVGGSSPTGWQAIALAGEEASEVTVQAICADLDAAQGDLDE